MSTLSTNMAQDQHEGNMPVHPKKFIVWLFMASIVMMFAALSSAYVVRKGEGNWLEFELPTMFYFSTILILLSSGAFHMGYLSAKKNDRSKIIMWISLAAVFGTGFLLSQYSAWSELYGRKLLNGFGIVFGGSYSNPSGSFLYVLTGVHGFHIISGLVFVLIVMFLALKGKIHSKALIWVEACGTYWHFLGGLWIYLYIFLIINH